VPIRDFHPSIQSAYGPKYRSVYGPYYRVASLQHFHPAYRRKSLQVGQLTMGSELRQCVAHD
jgi:hypothetical protein